MSEPTTTRDPEETRSPETRSLEARSSQTRTSGTRTSRTRPSGTRSSETRSSEARSSDGEFRRQVRGSASAAELETLDPALEVDALGTFCPEPVIRTQDRIREIEPGEVLLLLADDSGVEVDIPAWCMSTGNEYLGLVAGDEAYRVYVRRGS